MCGEACISHLSGVSPHFRKVGKSFASGQCGPGSIPGRCRSWSDAYSSSKLWHSSTSPKPQPRPLPSILSLSLFFGLHPSPPSALMIMCCGGGWWCRATATSSCSRWMIKHHYYCCGGGWWCRATATSSCSRWITWSGPGCSHSTPARRPMPHSGSPYYGNNTIMRKIWQWNTVVPATLQSSLWKMLESSSSRVSLGANQGPVS